MEIIKELDWFHAQLDWSCPTIDKVSLTTSDHWQFLRSLITLGFPKNEGVPDQSGRFLAAYGFGPWELAHAAGGWTASMWRSRMGRAKSFDASSLSQKGLISLQIWPSVPLGTCSAATRPNGQWQMSSCWNFSTTCDPRLNMKLQSRPEDMFASMTLTAFSWYLGPEASDVVWRSLWMPVLP